MLNSSGSQLGPISEPQQISRMGRRMN